MQNALTVCFVFQLREEAIEPMKACIRVAAPIMNRVCSRLVHSLTAVAWRRYISTSRDDCCVTESCINSTDRSSPSPNSRSWEAKFQWSWNRTSTKPINHGSSTTALLMFVCLLLNSTILIIVSFKY